MAEMVRFDNVGKRYDSGVDALSGITFSLDAGEIAFLTGRSGAGKSTLLKLITLIDRATRGQIYIGGKNLTSVKRRQIPYFRRDIGIVFQQPKLLADRTVFDNVALPLIISGNFHHAEIGRRVRASLDKVGLLDKERAFPPQLSGGEQQRVGIARAVVNRPPLLVADEPTGNLDPALSAEIMNLFDQFSRVGTTVLIASHDLALISRMGRRVLTLQGGALMSSGAAPP
ncbi:MAG: cell division transport system ATP-binding protein [Gammaproteobacteria bacterium]|nr:MAG: cell division transport system ATP-binding protein [Gammaproteobacteria bacterium]TND02994.1 MAG: cell division transport system ATP-binding protein [Gammaproteobacteria bacterium]